jgi:dTMP kinase
MFVTFEGLDGSGKSTQAALLHDYLSTSGRQAILTREPGGTPLGEEIREIVLHKAIELTPWAEAALFAAARAELVERVIRPALERGEDVVCDRYIDSSLAYQGIARNLGIDRVLELSLQATRGLLPDRTFLVQLDPGVAAGRSGGEPDRIEREDDDFRARVDTGYRELATLFPRRVVPVDGSRPAQEISILIRGQVRDLL